MIEIEVGGEIGTELVKLPCIIHQQTLCTKSAPLNDAMIIKMIIIYEFVYRNNLSACQACCYH